MEQMPKPIAPERSGRFEFKPDLIVEATMLCDWGCKGCYAPVILQKLAIAQPDVFLPVSRLREALDVVSSGPKMTAVSVRGGEPFLHPQLAEILCLLAPMTEDLYLETHGRWIADDTVALLQVLANTGTIVKLSFDSMHRSDATMLSNICAILDDRRIVWIVAVTEDSEAAFLETRSRCPWVSDDRIVFQQKAFTSQSLFRPSMGVIHADGNVSAGLRVIPSFWSTEASLAQNVPPGP